MADTADRDANHAQRARFDEVFGQYERLRAGLDDIQQKVADLRGTAESDEALVRATVGGRGQLVNLKLDRRVFLMDPAEEEEEPLATQFGPTLEEKLALGGRVAGRFGGAKADHVLAAAVEPEGL